MTISAKRNPFAGCYRVICRHRGPDDPPDAWRRVTVVIKNVDDAQGAADNACLFLIWDRQGEAEAELVSESSSQRINVHGGIFDAEEYEETITFLGTILSASA